MAREQVGVVVEVIGRVVATSVSGETRVLAPADVVYADDSLTTAPGAYVLVRLVDGTLLDLGGAAQLELADYAPADIGAQASAEVDEIQALIRQGGDPTAPESGVDPTAAGNPGAPGADDDGHGFVVRVQEYVQVDPLAGIPTAAAPLAFPDVVFDRYPVDEADDESPVGPVLVVGSPGGDQPGTSDPHVVPRPDGPDQGDIRGGAGADILIGDPGGTSLLPGQSANLVLVLDTSGSMTERTIPFNGSAITRQAALQQATIKALQDLQASGAENVRVQIVHFNTQAAVVGTFDLITDGVANDAELARAIAAVEGLPATTGATNYEAGMLAAAQWAGSDAIIPNADVNKVLFVSDGEPTRHYQGDGATVPVGTGRELDPFALAQLTGTDTRPGDRDTISEIGLIQAAGFTIEAVGINVGGDPLDVLDQEAALDLLDQVEGAAPGSPGAHAADNVTSAEQLSALVGQLTGAQVVVDAAGNDVITGGAGDDLIFGDVPHTDALATAQGLTTPAGSGWLVFQQLEAGQGSATDWDRADSIEYIRAHPTELAAESGRDGGHDSLAGGAGADTLFGQEGNDILIGGQGDDLLIGGSGADAFVWQGGDLAGTTNGDLIADFNLAAGDRLDVADLLSGYQAGSDVSGFLSFEAAGADTVLRIDTDGGGDNFQVLATLKGVAPPPDINTLVGNGQLVVSHDVP